MRTLIYVPIVHTPVDMGFLLEKIRSEHIARHGIKEWQEHLRLVDDLWDRIAKEVLALPLDYNRTKVYQDGLPRCDRELEIVSQLASEGSKNHQLLLDLVKRGATLVGTEDPEMLMEEHQRLTKAKSSPEFTVDERGSLYDDLMERRDKFIAQRIAETLAEGEVGILLIGALHRVAEWLPDDMEVHHLLRTEERGGR